MKSAPITPAQIRFDDPRHPQEPYAPAFGDRYHPRIGAFAQARHVFLNGNGLPQRWQGRQRFVILETGFGLGNNFLATWEAWRQDPQRSERLCFVSIEKHPPRAADLAFAHHQGPHPCPAPELADALLAQWPPATPDLHALSFDGGRVQLLLAWGDVSLWLPELVAEVDAFYLDGFSPACNTDMWDPRLMRQLARLGKADATAATWTVARTVRDGLSAAGFLVERRPGFGSKRDMICATRRRALSTEQSPTVPLHHAPPPGRRAAARHRTALVIGAGLAGATAAHSLAAQGLTVTVLERRAEPAQETSGNLAGLFHGVVHPQDGAHAQLLRAAALHAERHYTALLQSGQVSGGVGGLLRGTNNTSLAALQSAQRQLNLPDSYACALDPQAATALAGLQVASPGWHFPGGGWLSPAALVRHWLSGTGIHCLQNACVAQLRPTADQRWQALDELGQVLAEADVAVVAGAQDGLRLLAPWTDLGLLPLRRSRGQVTRLTAAQIGDDPWPQPKLPLASGSYVISLPAALGGGLLCGATNQPDDADPSLRLADHASNLRLALQWAPKDDPGTTDLQHRVDKDPAWLATLQGRVGWRLACDDRLPLVGPVALPLSQLQGIRRLEQPRQIPRQAGLYLLSALGSRGITLAPLLGEVLAAWITGTPQAISASLLDAVDPARFVARRARYGR